MTARGLTAVDRAQWSGYAGPAALVRFSPFAPDSRDETHRRPYAALAGLPGFPHQRILHEICPQGIDIIADVPGLAADRLCSDGNGAKPDIDTASTTPLIVARN